MQVRYATPRDLDFVSQDGYLPRSRIRTKIAAREVVVAERDGRSLGYARIEYLWSRLPYLALIRVLPESRRQGVGRALLVFLERELGAAGHEMLLSSSQADEPEPQQWHRHMGFHDCGRLEEINPGGVAEVFFRKPFPEIDRTSSHRK